MKLALWLVALFGVAVALALLFGGNQSTVTLFWPPHRIDVSFNLVLIALLAGFVGLHFALRTLSAFFALPRQARRWRLQQKERAINSALTQALSYMLTGRYIRSIHAAEQVLQTSEALQSVTQVGEILPKHLQPLQILAHLIAAESAHALRDRELRSRHLEAAIALGRAQGTGESEEVMEAAHLGAARWALSDREPEQAMQFLDVIKQGTARRTLALRLRLKATRLNRQHAIALDTARLLKKHGAFSETAANSMIRELVLAHLNDAHDSAQLQMVWGQLDASEKEMPEVVLHATDRLHKLGAPAAEGIPWLTPLWNLMVQQPDSCAPSIRHRIVLALSRTLLLMPPDADWLVSVDRARQAYPRWVELQFLAGMVCWHHALWGKAQQMLEMAAPQSMPPELQRQAWRTLALLAEQKEETARAQIYWKRAAEVVVA
jgi:HemY protein